MTTFTTLGRYMANRFVVTILGVFFLMLLLIFFIDFIEVMRMGSKRDDVGAGTLALISIMRVPIFAELALPFSVLIGTMGAFLGLSRSSELTIVRSAGLSVWQFLQPAVIVAAIYGVLSVTVYNPLASADESAIGADSNRAFRCQQELRNHQGIGLLAEAGERGWANNPPCKKHRQSGADARWRDAVAI